MTKTNINCLTFEAALKEAYSSPKAIALQELDSDVRALFERAYAKLGDNTDEMRIALDAESDLDRAYEQYDRDCQFIGCPSDDEYGGPDLTEEYWPDDMAETVASASKQPFSTPEKLHLPRKALGAPKKPKLTELTEFSEFERGRRRAKNHEDDYLASLELVGEKIDSALSKGDATDLRYWEDRERWAEYNEDDHQKMVNSSCHLY